MRLQGAHLRLYRSLARLPSRQQLRAVAASNPSSTSSEFLFFLRDLEQAAKKAEQAGKQLVLEGGDGQPRPQQASWPDAQQAQVPDGQSGSLLSSMANGAVALPGADGRSTAAVWRPSAGGAPVAGA